MNAYGSERTRLTNSVYFDLDPVWSPDGSQFAFITNRNGVFDIYLMDHDGSNQRVLVRSPAIDIGPVWSPDGEKILFSSNRSGAYNLYVIQTDGTGLTDRNSTRLNSSHVAISYAVFCLKKKKYQTRSQYY